jgi:hypothetical protein
MRKKIVDKFKKHKAPEIDGITTELLQKSGPTLWNRNYKLIKQVWEEEKMTLDWRTGLIFPILKKKK